MSPSNVSIELLPTQISLSEFVSILKHYDFYFHPRLSELNVIDIWAEKVYSNAIIDCFKDENNQLIGLAAYYCNDLENFVAYLTLIFIDKKFQGKGLANRMFNQILQTSKLKGMRTLKLECAKENLQAQRFYEKMGGHLYSQNSASVFYSFLLS